MKSNLRRNLGNPFKRAHERALSARLPEREEIERFGSDGEELICRLLSDHFDCVIRNAVVPHKDKFLEKDFLVIEKGVPFVIEVKNWKGVIGAEGDSFYQDKPNGVRKTLKSPVGTTNQFLTCMQRYYKIERLIYGIVVFAEPDCTSTLPDEMDGIALVKTEKLVPLIKSLVKKDPFDEAVDPDRILRCTRFYSETEEFCKGILADGYLELLDRDGNEVLVDTTRLRFITVSPQPLRLCDKLYVTFDNGASDIFYNRATTVTVACLDGTFRKIAISRTRHIVF